jgi:tRNA (guanine37-N1)-methyltransferase
MRIDVFYDLPARRRVLLESLLGRARTQSILDLRCHDLREHTTDVHRTVDDTLFGGGRHGAQA